MEFDWTGVVDYSKRNPVEVPKTQYELPGVTEEDHAGFPVTVVPGWHAVVSAKIAFPAGDQAALVSWNIKQVSNQPLSEVGGALLPRRRCGRRHLLRRPPHRTDVLPLDHAGLRHERRAAVLRARRPAAAAQRDPARLQTSQVGQGHRVRRHLREVGGGYGGYNEDHEFFGYRQSI